MAESMKDLEKELEQSYQKRDEQEEKLESLNEEQKTQWEELQTMMDEKTILDVKVKEAVKSGVVAYVNNVRGFIPASKLSLSYVENLDDFTGQHLKVQIIDIDPEKKRLVLSAKDVLLAQEAEKKEKLMSKIEVGMVLEGVVDSIKPYGAFILLDNGLSGLVHISQISVRRIKSPSEVLKKGDQVKVKVIQIKDGKLSLSIRALQDENNDSESREKMDLPKSQELTTSLGSLFADMDLDL